MFKNYSNQETPKTKSEWKELTNDQREFKILNQIKSNKKFKDLEVVKTPDNGQIEIKIETPLAANVRGDLLLDFEELLKKNIDDGLTVWCIPVGDKSKLRKLRGINIQT